LFTAKGVYSLFGFPGGAHDEILFDAVGSSSHGVFASDLTRRRRASKSAANAPATGRFAANFQSAAIYIKRRFCRLLYFHEHFDHTFERANGRATAIFGSERHDASANESECETGQQG